VNRPKMIIFDYGQTLVNEKSFDGLKGTRAVLREATRNLNNISAEEIQAMANKLNEEIGRYGTEIEEQPVLEIHNHMFQNYLYEYFGIELTKSAGEVEQIFEIAALDAEPTKNIIEFLQYLEDSKIRTGVISNTSFSGERLQACINRYIPSHKFEFMIASSEYIFRKPHKRIFELALRKANLAPCDVWYIGDNALCDVDGATDCGIFAVWYKGAIEKSNKYIPKTSCLEINDWTELMEILKSLK
jgi:putative hydrolase of the HAD superfamily